MRSPQDKLVKILLASGTGIHLYSDPETLNRIESNDNFYKFKDDNSDKIYIAASEIAGFEVLDDRAIAEVQDASQAQQMPEL